MVRSTFSGFTMAQLALSASQRALDVTGQNIGNVKTHGYTRQRLDLASISPVGASYSNSSNDCRVGLGVMMTGVTQVRDPFLDLQYRGQLSKVGTADAKDQILTQLGNIFDESDSEAVRSAMNNLVSQLNNIKTENANQGGSDALVRSAAEVLINAIHQNATSVKAVKGDVISKLKEAIVPDINKSLEAIAELNESIKNSQILGSPALELMDERNSLIDDLATYLPINVKYDDLKLGSGMEVEKLNITFTDANGVVHTLIDDNKKAVFTLTPTPVTDLPMTLTIADAVNPGGPGMGANVADLLKEGILKGNLDMLNKSDIFDGSTTKGIGYYEKKFDTFVSTFAKVMNDLNATVDANGNKVEQPLFTTINGATTGFTAENIKVSDAWMNGTVKLTTTKETPPPGTTTPNAYENVLKMIAALSTDKHTFEYVENGKTITVFSGTMFEGYDSIQNTQAIEKKASSAVLKNHVSVMNQIADSKDGVSGVYLDEEVMNLMRYQQSYNAAAKLMTTMDELLNTLINI